MFKTTHEFVVSQITDDCILGLDFLCRCGTVVDLANGFLWGLFGMVQLLMLARKGDGLAEHMHEADRQTLVKHTPQAVNRTSVLFHLVQCSCEELTCTQAEVAKQLLHEFKDVFAVDESECMHKNLVQHPIDTSNAARIRRLVKRAIAEHQI